MKLVSVLVAGDDAELVDAHLGFHLNAGVDLVLASDDGSGNDTSEVLEAYARMGHLHRVSRQGAASEAEQRARMSRAATTEHAADWVLSVDADEFWWPRGESLKDVLVAVPPRYGVVQGLVRVFPPGEREGFFADVMTARPSLAGSSGDPPEPLPWALRPVYRADARLGLDSGDSTDRGRRVPLRAWYPIEILRFPFRSLEQAARRCSLGLSPRSTLEVEACGAHERGVLAEWYADVARAVGGLAVDERLRDALHALRASDGSGSPMGFGIPAERSTLSHLKVPDIVEDASYAGECAAVGEVDLERLEREIIELEGRIAWLEERLWPRVLRQLSRLVPR